MIVATRMVPYVQWRLMNLIATHPNHSATVLVAAADADHNDVLALEQADYLTVTADGVSVGATLAFTTFLPKGSARFRLTAAGRDWVRTNPRNKVLAYLAARHGGGYAAPLRKVREKTGVDADVFFALEDAGLVQVSLGKGGQAMSNLAHALKVLATKSGDDRGLLWVRLTRKGRDLAGVSS